MFRHSEKHARTVELTARGTIGARIGAAWKVIRSPIYRRLVAVGGRAGRHRFNRNEITTSYAQAPRRCFAVRSSRPAIRPSSRRIRKQAATAFTYFLKNEPNHASAPAYVHFTDDHRWRLSRQRDPVRSQGHSGCANGPDEDPARFLDVIRRVVERSCRRGELRTAGRSTSVRRSARSSIRRLSKRSESAVASRYETMIHSDHVGPGDRYGATARRGIQCFGIAPATDIEGEAQGLWRTAATRSGSSRASRTVRSASTGTSCPTWQGRGMNMAELAVVVRPEEARDSKGVRTVNEQAFGRPNERHLVDALRGAHTFNFPSSRRLENESSGTFSFTPLSNPRARRRGVVASGLGPMAVLPGVSDNGIGSHNLFAGRTRRSCRASRTDAVVVIGHPEFPPRFGFVPAATRGLRCSSTFHQRSSWCSNCRPAALSGSSGGFVKYRPEFAAFE